MLPWIFALGFLCIAIERLWPGWKLPAVRTWPFRVVLVNLFQLGVVLLAGLTWDRWLTRSSLFELADHVSPATGGFIGYLAGTFVFYWWHRWRHRVDVLWRFFHQIHHSPRRIELITSFYKHPVEMVANSLIGSTLVYTILGLDLAGGAVFTFCCAAGEFFYHSNVRTPRWVGYFFQRPEMHRIHHEYGRHRNNYGDLAIWDMLFGTYENPAEFKTSCGFDPGREEQLLPMLAFRDVHHESQPHSRPIR